MAASSAASKCWQTDSSCGFAFCPLQCKTCICLKRVRNSHQQSNDLQITFFLAQVRNSRQGSINHGKFCSQDCTLSPCSSEGAPWRRKALIWALEQGPLALQSQRRANTASSPTFDPRLRSDLKTAALPFLSGHPRVRGRSVDRPRRCADACVFAASNSSSGGRTCAALQDQDGSLPFPR